MTDSTETAKAARVLIVDDHPVVREGLAAKLSTQPDLEVCGEAEDIAVAKAESYVLGDPFDSATTLGPVATAAAHARVRNYIRVGVMEGARLLAGGDTRSLRWHPGRDTLSSLKDLCRFGEDSCE